MTPALVPRRGVRSRPEYLPNHLAHAFGPLGSARSATAASRMSASSKERDGAAVSSGLDEESS